MSDQPQSSIDLQIAFAGHRLFEEFGDAASIEAKVFKTFELIKASGIQRARLLTGLADGADQFALKAWRAADMGPVHAVLPFLGDEPQGCADGSPAATVSWLDGEAQEAQSIHPHLVQTRWLLNAADLLVVVWNGAERRGPGGTADAVRIAFEAGIPTLWITSDSDVPLLIRRPPAHHLVEFTDLRDALETGDPAIVAPATVEKLREELGTVLVAHDWTPPKQSGYHRWLHRWLWRTYAVFQQWLGGQPLPSSRKIIAPPPELAAQPGFAFATRIMERADHHASELSAIHRSEQLLLLTMAVLAAFAGASWLIFPGLKILAVSTELALALAALAVWWSAARSRQHERWTEARRLAEQFRFERAGWVIGIASREDGASLARHRHRKLARSLLRQAPPPTGCYDEDRIARWVPWAIDELIIGQADYHRQQAHRNHNIAHKIELVETVSFAVLMVSLGAMLIAWAILALNGHHLPEWVGGVVGSIGVVTPAIAASTMALEAKFQFEELAQRSAVLSERLHQILTDIGENPSLITAQGAIRAASTLLGAEADMWHEGGIRRRLVRGG